MKTKNQSSLPSKYWLLILAVVCVILLGIERFADVISSTVTPFTFVCLPSFPAAKLLSARAGSFMTACISICIVVFI